MELHKTTYEGRQAYLFVDDEERIVERPTEFFRWQVKSARKPAKGTLDRYSEKIRDFCNFLEGHEVYGQMRLDDAIELLRRPIVNAFYKSLQDSGQGESSVRLAEAAVRKFTNWLNTDAANYVHKRPIYPEKSEGMTPSVTGRKPRWLDADDVIKLLKHMHFEAQRLVTHFMYDTGLRISEVPRVLLVDLLDWHHYPDGQMYFPLLVRGSKGRNRQIKERYTIISRPMLSRLAKYHNTHGYLFNFDFEEKEKPALLNVFNEAWTEKSLQAVISRARDRAKMLKASPHRLRHGTAYSVMGSEHGKSLLDCLVVVQQMLGHTDIKTTERYSDIPAVIIRQIMESQSTQDVKTRYEEAQRILDSTFLPQKKEPLKMRIGAHS
jgi:integrase/recombinase XerD